MKEIDFLIAYVSYVDSMIKNERLPLTSDEYREQMELETELCDNCDPLSHLIEFINSGAFGNL